MRKAQVLISLAFLMLLFPPFVFADGGFEVRTAPIDLDSVISRVLADHDQIQRAQARLEKEKALFHAARRRIFPRMTVDVYSGREFAGRDQSDYFWSSGLRLSLFEGGKRVYEMKREAIEVDQEKLHLKEDELETIYKVKVLYLNTLKEEELLKLAQEWVRETQRHERILKILWEKNLVQESEFLSAASLYEAARLELIRHEEAYDYGQSLLRELLGLKSNQRLELAPLAEVQDREIRYDSLIEGVRKAYPLYQIRPLRLKELEEEKQILGSERLPNLAFVTRFSSSRIDFDQNRYELGISASWNVWDWGVISSQIRAKEAEIREVNLENRIRLRQFEAEMRQLISDYEIQKRNTRALEAYLKEARKGYEVEKVKFLVGKSGGIDVLESFIQLTKAQMKWVEGIFEKRTTLAQIEKVTGGIRL